MSEPRPKGAGTWISQNKDFYIPKIWSDKNDEAHDDLVGSSWALLPHGYGRLCGSVATALATPQFKGNSKIRVAEVVLWVVFELGDFLAFLTETFRWHLDTS